MWPFSVAETSALEESRDDVIGDGATEAGLKDNDGSIAGPLFPRGRLRCGARPAGCEECWADVSANGMIYVRRNVSAAVRRVTAMSVDRAEKVKTMSWVIAEAK